MSFITKFIASATAAAALGTIHPAQAQLSQEEKLAIASEIVKEALDNQKRQKESFLSRSLFGDGLDFVSDTKTGKRITMYTHPAILDFSSVPEVGAEKLLEWWEESYEKFKKEFHEMFSQHAGNDRDFFKAAFQMDMPANEFPKILYKTGKKYTVDVAEDRVCTENLEVRNLEARNAEKTCVVASELDPDSEIASRIRKVREEYTIRQKAVPSP